MGFRRLTTLLFLTVVLLSVGPSVTHGQATNTASTPTNAMTFTPEIPIPGLFEGTVTIDSYTIARYIRALFIFFVWAVGIVATVMVVYGGIKWVAAAGNPSKINDARDVINSAVIGVIIALSSVVLLNIINPGLTAFRGLTLAHVDMKNFVFPEGDEPTGPATGATSQCPSQSKMTALFGSTEAEVRANLVSVKYFNTVTGTQHTYQVNSYAASAFQAVFNDIKSNPYDIAKESSGGTFVWRANRNANSCLSLHAFAIAIDINPSKNPNCPKGTACYTTPVTDIPAEIKTAFAAHGFKWGGDWRSVKDYMHFEWHGQ